MADYTLSAADQQLSAEQQEQILALKKAWADANAAGNKEEMDKAHAAAEAIRNSAGYSGGADGSGDTKINSSAGGASAQDVQKWVDDSGTPTMTASEAGSTASPVR